MSTVDSSPAAGAVPPAAGRPAPSGKGKPQFSASVQAARANRAAKRRVAFKRDRTLIIMAMPAVILLLVFTYVPMLGSVMAFQAYDLYDGFWNSVWVGLDNFIPLFQDPTFIVAMRNTLVISAVQLVLYFPIPIALAVMLNSVVNGKIRSFIQSVVYLPHFFSWVLVVTIFQQMFGGAGMLNTFLRAHDLGTFDIMTSPDLFPVLVTSQAVWKEAGWGIIVFLAAIAGIDPSLYEAAAVDGASRWRRMWHITLPGMRPVIVLMLVLRLGNALTVGFEQMLIQRDAVGRDAAEVLDTFSYYYGVVTGNFSYGAAAGLFKGVLSLLLILAANKVAHMLGEDGLYRG